MHPLSKRRDDIPLGCELRDDLPGDPFHVDIEEHLGSEVLHVPDSTRPAPGVSFAAHLHPLRPHSEPDLGLRCEGGGQLQAKSQRLDGDAVQHAARQDVYLGIADELGDVDVPGVRVDLARGSHLQDIARHDQGDAVGHGHRLGLIVGHVDERDAQSPMQLGDFRPHLGAQIGVQIRQRFIHQEHLGMSDQRAPDGDALALSARELDRLSGQQMTDFQALGDLLRVELNLLADGPGPGQETSEQRQALKDVQAPHLQGHTKVSEDRHVGIEGVGLKDHGDIALLGRKSRDGLLANQHLALVLALEAGDDPQQCGLAATGRTDEREELAVGDIERDSLDDLDGTERLGDLPEFDARHGAPKRQIP